MKNNLNVNDPVPIGPDIYFVKKIENGYVYLRKNGGRGKMKKIYWREVPYFEDGKLVVPTMDKMPSFNSKIHLGSFFKKNSTLQVSKEFVAFAYEHIESILHDLLQLAHDNAVVKGHKRLLPAHWYLLELRPGEGKGYIEEQNDYAIKESAWIHEDEKRRDNE